MTTSTFAQAAARARAQQQYQQAQTLTVSPGQLVVLLYDGVLRFARRARLAIADRNYEAAHNALCRAQAIISELDATLNDDTGAIATSLHRIYAYCLQRLIEANVQKDADRVGEVITHFETLLEAWRQAIGVNAPPQP
jgi:flagellar protein FliS